MKKVLLSSVAAACSICCSRLSVLPKVESTGGATIPEDLKTVPACLQNTMINPEFVSAAQLKNTSTVTWTKSKLKIAADPVVANAKAEFVG